MARHLVGRDAATTVRDQRLLPGSGVRTELDERDRHVAPTELREADHLSPLHRLMFGEELFDLSRVDQKAAEPQ